MTTTYKCTCGRELSFYSIAGHLKSKIHKELLDLKIKELELGVKGPQNPPNEEYILLRKK